jgi:Nuclease-related domain
VESESLPRLGSAPGMDLPAHADEDQLDDAALERVERRIAKYARGGGLLIVHDIAVPATATVIDHLCIGPHGITAVDVERSRTGDGQAELADRVLREAEILAAVLSEVGVAADRIRGAICHSSGALPPLGFGGSRGSITIGDERAVARLARRQVKGRRVDVQLSLAVIRNRLGREGQRSHRLTRPDGF